MFESEFFLTYVAPPLWMLAQSVLMLVLLLVTVAYILYADRKIWAAVQMRRGPERGWTMGAVSVLRRHAQVRLQGSCHSRWCQQGRIPDRTAGDLYPGTFRLGRWCR